MAVHNDRNAALALVEDIDLCRGSLRGKLNRDPEMEDLAFRAGITVDSL